MILQDTSILLLIALVGAVNGAVMLAAAGVGAPRAPSLWFAAGSFLLMLSPATPSLIADNHSLLFILGFNLPALAGYACWLLGTLAFCGEQRHARRVLWALLALVAAVILLSTAYPQREWRIFFAAGGCAAFRFATALVLLYGRERPQSRLRYVFAGLLGIEGFTMAARALAGLSGVVPMVGQDAQLASVVTWLTMLLAAAASTPMLLLLSLGRTIGALRQSGERLRATLDAMPDTVFELDGEGRYAAVHASQPDLLPAPREQLIGRRPGEVLPAQAAAVAESALHLASLHGRVGGQVYPLTLGGQPHWFELSAAARGDAPGHVVVVRDISDRIRAEQQLRYRTVLFDHLYRQSPIGLLLSDVDSGRLIEANPAFLAQSGLPGGELARVAYLDLFAAAPDGERVQAALRVDGNCGPLELEWRRADGEVYPVLLTALSLRDPAGRMLLWSIIEDISDRKRIERMKNEFISTVSHELRTPLTAISGALALVTGGALGPVQEQARHLLEVAHRNSQRLSALVNDLLDLDKLVAGQMRFEVQRQPLRPLLEAAVEALRTYGSGRSVRLLLVEPVPDCAVRVDGQRLQQVLANLLSNAIKFSPEGGAEVEIRCEEQPDSVRIGVRDHGAGVPEAFRAHLFEKFAQADGSDTRQRGGSGLGLAIAREMIQRMGGSIGYQPAPGGGACFVLELPLAE